MNLYGCIPNCRFHFEAVVGEDTDHGGLPWLVSPPARIFMGALQSLFVLFVKKQFFIVSCYYQHLATVRVIDPFGISYFTLDTR